MFPRWDTQYAGKAPRETMSPFVQTTRKSPMRNWYVRSDTHLSPSFTRSGTGTTLRIE
jgi:hypothetical protein